MGSVVGPGGRAERRVWRVRRVRCLMRFIRSAFRSIPLAGSKCCGAGLVIVERSCVSHVRGIMMPFKVGRVGV